VTPLEDRIRQALRGEAGDIPPGTAPPLRLPARRRRFFALAYGGGESKEAPAAAWRGWLVPVAAAVVVAAVIAGVLAVSRTLPVRGRLSDDPQAAAVAINEAAAWTGAQVSRSAHVSCDPVMCQALAAHQIPAGDLDVLKPGAASPLRSDVLVATPLVRREFGGRLSSVYARVILASFGSGATRVDIRAIALQGAAAYGSALSADQQSRRAAGRQLSDNKQIVISAVARRQMLAGRVDSRLLTTLAVLTTIHSLSVVAFGDSGPGAAPGVPLRSVELATPSQTAKPGRPLTVQRTLAMVNKQLPPYRPARAGRIRLRDGQTVIRIEFAAPSPLGLLGPGRRTSP
jgi:hypothetical protein